MAGMNSSIPMRAQLAAIANLRWRMFVNGLRTKRGKMELASRVIVTAAFSWAASGLHRRRGSFPVFRLSRSSRVFASHTFIDFFFWQVFPVMATAFTNKPDSSDLLRFPGPPTDRSF